MNADSRQSVPLRRLLAGLTLGVSASAIVLALGWAGWLETAELKTYDWRLRAIADPASVNRDIVLVEINDTTIRDFAGVAGRWPWPRVLHSLLIDFLRRAPARVVAVDIGFFERDRVFSFPLGEEKWSGEDSDKALAESVRASGNVIMLADAVNPGVAGEQASGPSNWRAAPYRLGPAIEPRPVLLPPYQALADGALGFGHNFLALDPDGPARRMPPFVRNGNKYMPSLGIAAALAAGGFRPEEVVLEPSAIVVRDRHIPLVPLTVVDPTDRSRTHEQLAMLINYRAPALLAGGQRPYTSYEARHLLKSEAQMLSGEKPDVDPALFKDKIVFVGVTASGLVDVFQTPFGSKGTMPGIQLHASMADSLLSNRFIWPAPDWWRAAIVVTAAIGVGLMAAMLPFAAAAAGALAAMAGWTWTATVALRHGLWLSLASPILAVALALFAGTAYRYFVEDREKRKVKRLFGRYVSKDVYEQLLTNPGLAELGGSRRDMSVLFSDIRGFTTVTERGNPDALVAQLNEYFSCMVDVVFRHGGTIDKFVGDMVMALFGAPLPDANHAEHAVMAAVDMVRELKTLNERWAKEGHTQFDIGIGINSGNMIAGNIGSASIMSYTVIGDNVNLGSRLESLNKEYQTRIIISEATRTRLTGDYEIRPLGAVVVKGKTRPVTIFDVKVPPPLARTAEEEQL